LPFKVEIEDRLRGADALAEKVRPVAGEKFIGDIGGLEPRRFIMDVFD
jgi:hypothetical protein